MQNWAIGGAAVVEQFKTTDGNKTLSTTQMAFTNLVQAMAGIATGTATSIADVTGFPEIMDGRVKTLHPAVHGGILARRSRPDDIATLGQHRITPIDMVIVNLYPFVKTAARPDIAFDALVEEIDIGGPSMVRSAAKNHAYVTILTDPADYPAFLAELETSGGATTYDFRRLMAARAYSATAAYDAMISQWFAFADQQQFFPEMLAVNGRLVTELRYGENPHQRAALYVPVGPHGKGIAQAEQVDGQWRVRKAVMSRSARVLMEGFVRMPA